MSSVQDNVADSVLSYWKMFNEMVPEIRKAECSEGGVKKLANIIQSREFSNIIFICTKDPSHTFEKYQDICNKYKAFTTWLLGQFFYFLGSEKFLKVHDIVIDIQVNILKHLSKTKLHIYNELHKEYSKALEMLVDFYNNPQGTLKLEVFVPEKLDDLNDNLDLTQVFIEVSSESKCVSILEKMMKMIELFLLENFTFYSFDENTARNLDCLLTLFGSKNMSMKLSIVDIFLKILNNSTFDFAELSTMIHSKLTLFFMLYEQLVYKTYNEQIWTMTQDMEKFETGLILFFEVSGKNTNPILCLNNIYEFIYKKSLENKGCVPSQEVQVASLKKSQQHHNRQSHIHHTAKFGNQALMYCFENDIYKDILQKEHSGDLTKVYKIDVSKVWCSLSTNILQNLDNIQCTKNSCELVPFLRYSEQLTNMLMGIKIKVLNNGINSALQFFDENTLLQSFLSKYIGHIEICDYKRHLPVIYNFFANLCLLTYKQNLCVIFGILAFPLLKRFYLKHENSFSEFATYRQSGDTNMLMKSLFKKLSAANIDCIVALKSVVLFFEVISSGLVEVNNSQIQEIEKAFFEICKGAFDVREPELICEEMDSTYAVVLDVLRQASSQDPSVLKPAETKLREWETQPGFYAVLLNILADFTMDVNIRFMAVLCLKNGVDRYWRKNAPNAISEQEKSTIRQGLLCNFEEPVNQIAVQRAVLISKVARMDWPREWPNVFPILLQAIESPNGMVQHRSLLTLHHVVKAVASKRLAGDKRLFQEFTSSIYTFILNLWNGFNESFVQNVVNNAAGDVVFSSLEKALLTLRVVRKLTVFGFHKPHENHDSMSFLKILLEKAKIILQCHKQIKEKDQNLVEQCEKYIIHMTKMHLSILDIHPFSFVDLIEPTLEFTFYYLFTDEGISFLFERFIIQCFSLIKNTLLCAEYKAAKVPEMTRNQETLRAHHMKIAFFTPERLADMCRKLVGHYFILTPDELAMWEADPEAFSNDETGDSWKYSLRPSIDTVFVTIFHEYRKTVTPVILDLMSSANALVSPDDITGILKKDAIYNAVGLCAFDLYEEVDFDQWFTTTLLQELKIKDNNYRVIRRRVIILMGRWTGIKLSNDLRPLLYDCINNLLSPEEDVAIRLAAATTLKYAIDDFDFDSGQFKNYMLNAFNLLFSLLQEVNECETKMQVLNVMTLLLERMGSIIQPHSDPLLQYLPFLWQESEEHNMLRCAIVSTMVQLVKVLGGVKPELNQFLLPVIQLGTDTTQHAIVYLLEDCLDLWLTMLEYSKSMTNEYVQLFNNMPTLLEYSTEILRQCLCICLVHLLLAPDLVMRTHGSQLMRTCAGIIGDLNNEGVVMLLRVVETFIRAVPALGTETVVPILPKIFQKVYQGEDYPMVMTMFLCILSRVVLSSHEIFIRIMNVLAQSHNETEHATFGRIMNVWLDKMRNVSQLDHRKLLGLALTNLLTTQSQVVLERFGLVMLNILETLNDITADGCLVDSLVITEGQSPSEFDEDGDGYYETDHDQRKKALIISDPIHTIALKDYLQSQLNEVKRQVGEQQYQQLWQLVDADTISQLKDYVAL